MVYCCLSDGVRRGEAGYDVVLACAACQDKLHAHTQSSHSWTPHLMVQRKKTPLMYAKSPAVVQLLQKAKADVNKVSNGRRMA